jgi:hypothetical protein
MQPNLLLSLPALLWRFVDKRPFLKVIVVVVAVALPVAAGLITGHFTDFGRQTDTTFFELVATIIPVFFLATFAVYLSPKAPERPVILVAVIVVDVILGEGLSLYAVAASTATTFLTVACAVALAGQVLDLAYVQVAYAAGSERPGLGQQPPPPNPTPETPQGPGTKP